MRPAPRVLASLVALLGIVAAGRTALAPRAACAAETAQAGAEAFKARLVQNLGVVTRASAALATAAKRKAPARGLTADQRRVYDEQTRWLGESATRFSALKARMEAALAKTKLSPSELAQLNLEFGTLRDAAQAESARFETAAPACKERQAAALAALRSGG